MKGCDMEIKRGCGIESTARSLTEYAACPYNRRRQAMLDMLFCSSLVGCGVSGDDEDVERIFDAANAAYESAEAEIKRTEA